ncbi:MAG: hypothetical protein IPI43_29740 [Sandaracinaceae bacterium]|nr:hypothetical protein [Sandaracinaceae bacterium]
MHGATRDARFAARLADLHLHVLGVECPEGQVELLGAAEVERVLRRDGHLHLDAVHAGHVVQLRGAHPVLERGAAGRRAVDDRQHGDHPLLEAVAAVDEAHVASAGVEDRRRLREHHVAAHPVVAEVAEGHAHFAGVVGSHAREDVPALRVDLAAVRLRRERIVVEQQKAVVAREHEALHASVTQQAPRGS